MLFVNDIPNSCGWNEMTKASATLFFQVTITQTQGNYADIASKTIT